MFKPGRSGNPAGRPRKPRTGPDKLRQDLLRQAPEILAKLVELAKIGDVPAAKEILGRCLPQLKPRDQAVSLDLGDGLDEAGRAVLAGLKAGAVTPDEGSKLASVIGTLARAAELTEFSRRLDDIERSLNESKQP